MIYFVSFLLCVVEVLLIWIYFKSKAVFVVCNGNVEANSTPKTNNHQMYAVLAVIFVMLLIASFITLKNVAYYLNYLKLIVLFGIVAAAAAVDLKKTIIPNFFILIGLGFRLIIYIIEFFAYKAIFWEQFKSDMIGVALGFGFLLIVSLITGGALGFGDVKLFGVIGIISGAICTYYTLILCLIVSTIISVVLLITKKKGRKDSIPLGPSILIGYFIALVLSCY